MHFRKVNVSNRPALNSDSVVIDRRTGGVVYLSVVGYSSLIKDMAKDINTNTNIYIERHGSYRTLNAKSYEVKTRKPPNSDFSHAIAYKKDVVTKNRSGEEFITAYLFFKNDEEKFDALYDKIYAHSSIPVLREWMPSLYDSLSESGFIRSLYVDASDDLDARAINISKTTLLGFITSGLESGKFTINDTKEVSETMQDVMGLDDYLNTFGETLAHRIQESFVPKFTPGVDEYSETVNDFDDSCYGVGLELFEAQKAVIQASVNNLKRSNTTFVVGEMGSGKTAIGAGITYSHGKQLGYNSVVMCPSHLVNKWKREVERLVPNSRVAIVKDLEDLLELEEAVKNKNKKENLYIVMSKESAKFGYEMSPAALWSSSKKKFICPECHKPLVKKTFEGEGRFRTAVYVPFSKDDMSKEYAFNRECMNDVKYWDKEEESWEKRPCGAKLWTPSTKENLEDSPWIKLGAEGWILKKHVRTMHEELITKNTLTRKEVRLMTRLAKQIEELDATNEFDVRLRAPRKYPLAQYIKKYWRGNIDYFIADEVHMLKGESSQGFAFDDLIKASKKTICLTGTLLNGYADGLFYILYRTVPYLMQKDGFDYSGESDFMKTYGVVKTTSRHSLSNGVETGRVGNLKEKRLPGVSPLVFTNYLLENAVFLSLSDMSEALPEYTEHPIGIEMDLDLKEAYDSFERDIRSHIGGVRGRGMKIMGQMVQSLSVFPDMPYNQMPVIHPDTGMLLVSPPDLGEGLRNKEAALLEIIDEKIAAGEKVLVYYQWTNRTDSAKKISDALTERGVSCAILESKVKADVREEWIEEKVDEGVQVVLCNPTLVETGLDLMDFTTIIFYQIGYNIFTMRQASRRSWRLGQENPIDVYYMYYRDTIQEQALSLMATKLQASMAIEGKFSEEGLRAMSNNEDLLTQIANSVVNGIKETVDADAFGKSRISEGRKLVRTDRVRKTREELLYRRPVVNRLSYFSPRDSVSRAQTAAQELFTRLLNKTNHISDMAPPDRMAR